MALLDFHYLITAFVLTIWTHAPFVIMTVGWSFQAIAWIAGIDVTDLNDFITYNWVSTLIGCAIGTAFLFVTRAPRMLRFKASYLGVWVQFALYVIFFLSAELFYGFFPPPEYPWGIIGMTITQLIIQVVLWIVIVHNEIIWATYTGRLYFFLGWLIMVLAMDSTTWLAYAIAERYATWIAGGVGLVILIVMYFLFPLRVPFEKSGGPVGGEPLMIPKGEPRVKIPGDDMPY